MVCVLFIRLAFFSRGKRKENEIPYTECVGGPAPSFVPTVYNHVMCTNVKENSR